MMNIQKFQNIHEYEQRKLDFRNFINKSFNISGKAGGIL